MGTDYSEVIETIDPERHVVIAGPTASGKSALALALAQAQGGTIVNADALQIWSCWRVLTARPDDADLAAAPHALYGHVDPGQSYSVGDWLGEVAALKGRLIVAGGTGLYLTALTSGLAHIPPVPPEIRDTGDAILAAGGLDDMIAGLDDASREKIDLQNPARVQRAWEVLQATGRSIVDWQSDTPPPLIAPEDATCLVLNSDRDWLAKRILVRFAQMWHDGAVEEVRAMMPLWDERAQWARAIGAPEIAAYLREDIDARTAKGRAIVATRQYAKSQRIWFRSRMKSWRKLQVGPAG
ncbi:MAG TPA: tRNA (adenosine(37)-N6)-dimethylallyltransferase MiaA [Paracoccus sp. (in: a-proteobacteria)]|uniref:tRNA (adenosine(37)-N6)-dimethylallyltransferase MiaA n=1 Tax=uncultured Paracoccus sp. TaxID=189685 RepID=UPI00261CA9E1|nr:tRNA (adenosine(37)-N6)-dimethylallyltransferase MiaA [uncultured Paracoccus sp.]HMQ41048.1 tRNA (adenosine(37)-N6)-dimethylallyltransferase MiaA [Paracoccus sp. (in: a-proteobacteria)]HMR34708.1 tRNA (adenosine(37)-N6)-dimethylallyltransferase MiaA [Paracoccus sp. (in: a-proteobacteria)]